MKAKRHVTNSYETDLAPGIEFELNYAPDDYSEELVARHENAIVIGYLVHDSNAESPLEWSDSKIVTSHRHSSSCDIKLMQAALGLDEYWNPDTEKIYDADCGTRQLVDDEYIEYFVDNTDVEQLLALGWERDEEQETRLAHGSSCTPDDTFKIQCAELDVSGGWQVFPEVFEAIELKYWNLARESGVVGNKYTVSLDVYEHSGTSYSVSGEGMQCRWDTARGGALWVPGQEVIENIKSVAARDGKDELQVAREFARATAEEYTSWCNGDCYGVVVTTYDAEGEELDSDECWCYIGREHAEKSLEETFNAVIIKNVAALNNAKVSDTPQTAQTDIRGHIQAVLNYSFEEEKKDFETLYGVTVKDNQQVFNEAQSKHIFYNLYKLKGELNAADTL